MAHMAQTTATAAAAATLSPVTARAARAAGKCTGSIKDGWASQVGLSCCAPLAAAVDALGCTASVAIPQYVQAWQTAVAGGTGAQQGSVEAAAAEDAAAAAGTVPAAAAAACSTIACVSELQEEPRCRADASSDALNQASAAYAQQPGGAAAVGDAR